MNKNDKIKSLSEQVAESLSRNLSASDESDSDTAPRVIHFNEGDYSEGAKKSCSSIRKQNVRLLSEQSSKYSGEIVSRENFSTSESSDNEFETTNKRQINFEVEQQSESSSVENSDVASNNDSDEESIETNLVVTKSSKNEIEKGLCVQNQLALWEKLLEIRIHSQKILNKANSLPCPESFAKLSTEKEFGEAAKKARNNAELLLQTLLETQVHLANQFAEIKKLEMCAGKRSYSESNESPEPSKKCCALIESNFEKFRPYRNSVLTKWDDRTRLLATSGMTKGKSKAEEFDILRKIDNILIKRDDHIAKSQKLKGNYTLFGMKQATANEEIGTKEDVFSPHIYDDTDFYHSQLRELIEFKSNISTDAYDVTKQYAELQKLRQKMKKKVDTRASKGRKIRYVVHHKLINFMAPNNTSEWSDESKSELYRSLFAS